MQFDQLRRREFITLAGGAVAWPLAAYAQGERMRHIGVLMGFPENDLEAQAYIAAFRDGLQKLGWTEGRNVRIDTRWATPADADSMQRFAKELVALQPEQMQFDQLKRREFITFLGAAATWPLTAHAQQPERTRRIGVLMAHAESDPEGQA